MTLKHLPLSGKIIIAIHPGIWCLYVYYKLKKKLEGKDV